jgi:hypothetical protein
MKHHRLLHYEIGSDHDFSFLTSLMPMRYYRSILNIGRKDMIDDIRRVTYQELRNQMVLLRGHDGL